MGEPEVAGREAALLGSVDPGRLLGRPRVPTKPIIEAPR